MYNNLKYNIQKKIICVKCEKENEANNTNRFLNESIEVGFTNIGLQVWCHKHNVNICHIDFEGIVLKGDFRCLEKKIN